MVLNKLIIGISNMSLLIKNRWMECGSHYPLLLPALLCTHGPVLEYGTGWHSTSLITSFSWERYCRSYESIEEWHARVVDFFARGEDTREQQRASGAGHDILFTPDMRSAEFKDKRWGVVFVDGACHHERADITHNVREHTQLCIVHDSEHDEIRSGFTDYKYQYDFVKTSPQTWVGSNTDDLEWLVDFCERYS
jgi:hypothetical protein